MRDACTCSCAFDEFATDGENSQLSYMSKYGTVGEKAWRSRRTRVTERIVEPGTLNPWKNFLAPIFIRGPSRNIYCITSNTMGILLFRITVANHACPLFGYSWTAEWACGCGSEHAPETIYA